MHSSCESICDSDHTWAELMLKRLSEPSDLVCTKCQAVLEIGLEPIGECDVCQQGFDLEDATSFRKRRAYQSWQFWLPSFLLAFFAGLTSYAFCLQYGSLGWALFVSVPVSFGAIYGYSNSIYPHRVSTVKNVGLTLILVVAVAVGVVSIDIAGFFCGSTLVLILIGPALVGLFLGSGLRMFLKKTAWSQRHFLPLLLFALLPYLAQGIESSFPRQNEFAEVRTRLHVMATPQEAWDAIMFYEEVDHQPPWLLSLALPKPVRSIGNKRNPGEVVHCVYDRGQLVKRISKVDPQRELAFDVIEQELHFERDVTLMSGSFLITPVNEQNQADGVFLELTTRYQRHLRPTHVWQPIEKLVIHTLHEHVLTGMRLHIEKQRQVENQPESTEPRLEDSTDGSWNDLALAIVKPSEER